MNKILLLFLSVVFCSVQLVEAQSKIVTNFYGVEIMKSVCKDSGSSLQDADVERLITDMLTRSGAENRFIIQSCNEINNCQAIVRKDGKAYLYLHPDFVSWLKSINITMGATPKDKDWKVLCVLAHELGHLVNNHFTDSTSNLSQHDLELEADEYAGYMLNLMGASLQHALLCMVYINETGSSTHPGRKERIRALEKGFNKAKTGSVNSSQLVNKGLEDFEIYSVVDVMPEFPGGIEGLFRFLAKNTKYPFDARKAGIEGTVYIGFVVLEDGKIDKIEIKNGLPDGGAGCDEEALRVLKKMPKWIPGKLQGRNVKVSLTLPFKFQLTD